MKSLFYIVSLIIISIYNTHPSFAQKNQSKNKPFVSDVINLGIGVGLDKGGIGTQIIGYPQKNIGILLGLGYNGLGLGYNVGIKARYLFFITPIQQ